MVLKTRFFFAFFFVKKLKISGSLDHTILYKFRLHVVQTFCKECMERPLKRLSMSALATVAGKSFNGKFTAKLDFPIGYLCYHC